MNPRPSVDITRVLLVIVILSALTVGSLYVLRPFLPGLIWASTIVVATWPAMLAIQRRCGNRRSIATSIMLLILLVVIVLPLYEAISTLALHASDIMSTIKGLPQYALPPPPEWSATSRSPASVLLTNGKCCRTPGPAACWRG